jgi:hypothetical protein
MIANRQRRAPAGNSTLAIGGVSSPLDSFEVTESSVLRINICAKKPAHRQSAKRYGQGKYAFPHCLQKETLLIY